MENKTDIIARPLVIIESPYAGEVETNITYAKRCMLDSISKGEAPFASHLVYTQILDDNVKVERETGIECGLAWLQMADKHVFYIDYGISNGMFKALQLTLEKVNRGTLLRSGGVYMRIPELHFRKIGKNDSMDERLLATDALNLLKPTNPPK